MLLLMLALALTPHLRWWLFGVLAWWNVLWLIADRSVRRGRRAELWATVAMANSIISAAVVVAGTGGARSPFSCMMVFQIAGLMTRYSTRVIVLGLALAFVSLVGAMMAVSAGAVEADPSLVVTPVALIGAVAALCWGMMKSETTQRVDAIVDPLTGLLNRRALVGRGVTESYHADVSGSSISLLMCDLDHFKSINDRHGHDRGDGVLREAAAAIRGELRQSDGAFRIGGEEFVVLLPGLQAAAARSLAERVCRAVERAQPAGIPTTVSIGVATLSGEQARLEQLLQQADKALYAAKRGGRNRVSVAGAGSSATESQRPGDERAADPSPESQRDGQPLALFQ